MPVCLHAAVKDALFRFTVLVCLAIMLPSAPGYAQDPPTLRDYAGKWVIKVSGRNFLVLSLKLDHDKLSGSLAMPKGFQWGQGGDLMVTDAAVQTVSLSEGSALNGHLDIVGRGEDKDTNHFLVTLSDHDHASLELVGVPLPLGTLQRVSDSEEVSVATSWPSQEPKVVSPEIAALQAELKEMVTDDQAVRTTSVFSDSKMKQIDEKHYPELLRIYEKYGWPRISVVGKEASGEYWLLVQHQNLAFQKRVLPALQRAVESGEASKVNYAYLYDRVMISEGKPQHWGTQGDCKDGKPVIQPVDDPVGLEQRRNELQLQPLDKYLEMLATQCAKPTEP